MSTHESVAFPAGPFHGTVVLNWRKQPVDEFGVYADAFHRAGSALVEQMEDARGYSDLDACPIMFLYRQSIELYIKAQLLAGLPLFNLRDREAPFSQKSLNGHVLPKFVPWLAEVYEVAGWKWKIEVPNCRTQKEFAAYVQAIDEVDRSSFAFRYPLARDWTTESLRKQFRFNVISFARAMDPILEHFDGSVTGLKDLFQRECEMRAEMGE